MPELPEVETIRLTLRPKLIGRKIIRVSVLLPKLIQDLPMEQFIRSIEGKIIKNIERRGKYLLLELTEGLTLSIHLRMTGQLTVESGEIVPAKTVYFLAALDDGFELRFSDVRKFGKIALFPTAKVPTFLNKLGPEPLSRDFTIDLLKQSLGRRQLAIKKALLNQEIIAGLGNIYTDEALFLAGIHPARPSNSLKDEEFEKLYHGIRQVLTEAIDHRGTTKRDYRDGEGKSGSHQDFLRVYGRKGLPCPVCQAPIVKINFGGRGTHFCPICQV